MKIVRFEIISGRPRELDIEFFDTDLTLARVRDQFMAVERTRWFEEYGGEEDYISAKEEIVPFNHKNGWCPVGVFAFELSDACCIYFAREGSKMYDYLLTIDPDEEDIGDTVSDWMDDLIEEERDILTIHADVLV